MVFLLMSQLLYSTINVEIREQPHISSGVGGPLPHGSCQADIPDRNRILVSYIHWSFFPTSLIFHCSSLINIDSQPVTHDVLPALSVWCLFFLCSQLFFSNLCDSMPLHPLQPYLSWNLVSFIDLFSRKLANQPFSLPAILHQRSEVKNFWSAVLFCSALPFEVPLGPLLHVCILPASWAPTTLYAGGNRCSLNFELTEVFVPQSRPLSHHTSSPSPFLFQSKNSKSNPLV